jgi:hypothetical protein
MVRTIPTQISLVKLGADIFVGARIFRHKDRERLLFLIRPSMSGNVKKPVPKRICGDNNPEG